ncbi:hypothetical protein JIN85_14450 [Luteolibacter pohnpeiensis]|uniref:Uncharacterized protein n=1 Tax=Luteolibacter pohnpeiensis TaxID=454153 RepID=A0A934S948_9BACT|nr:hypothetical protein [Luteolibacter pohnpeiensis]MBK1883620.1 hypothetical protein [Luteolibacter pohnpeiensis]
MKTPEFPDDDELEKLLHGLKPAPASPELLSRLQAARPLPRTRSLRLWIAAPLAAAAALAFAWLSLQGSPTSPSKTTAKHDSVSPEVAKSAEMLQAVKSEQTLLGMEDLGVTNDPKQGPVRLIRTTWVDEITYAKPGEAPEFSKSWIRSEIVPVSLPIF